MSFACILVGSQASAWAATMEVRLHIVGQGEIAGDGVSCSSSNADPANVRHCDIVNFTAPDPFGVPIKTFRASTSIAGWRFAGWTDFHFTSCGGLNGADCTIIGRQNAFVVREATAHFTRDAAPTPVVGSSTTTDRSARFRFQVGEPVRALDCALLLEATGVVRSGTCPEPGSDGWRTVEYEGLPEGLYRFQVKATDFFGHTAETVDSVAVVDTRIVEAPPHFDSNVSPRFRFAALPGSEFRCSIDGVLGLQSCGSPFTTPLLRPDGRYKLSVHARRGRFEDPTPATYDWTVDTTPPSAGIVEPAEQAVVDADATTFVFTAADNLTSTDALRFECRLDAGQFHDCRSPYTTPPLDVGPHTLGVRAVDAAGHRSVVVQRTWRRDFIDADGDGYRMNLDCDDGNPGVNPGVADIPGNDLDEDCAGGPMPYPRLTSSVHASWRFNPFRFSKLSVRRIVAGSTIVVSCKGRGCPFRTSTTRVRHDENVLSILGRLGDSPLRRGTTVTISVTKSGNDGIMRRYVVRSANRDPRSRDLCLPAGGGRPRRC